MATPRYGERYQNIKGWTIYVLGVKYRDSVITVNPEFYCEVRFIYESSGEYTEMPLKWFHGVYRKIAGTSFDYVRKRPILQSLSMPDYSWLDDNEK